MPQYIESKIGKSIYEENGLWTDRVGKDVNVQHTAAKWPAVIESPIANGADPLISARRSSQTPWTTNTNKNVINASMMTPCNGSK